MMRKSPISTTITPDDKKTYSTWDYGARTGVALGNQYGLGIAVFGIFSALGCDKWMVGFKDLICAVGGLLFGIAGGVYETIVGSKLQDVSTEEYEKNKPLIPWTQRVPTFAMSGGFLGGAIGSMLGPIGLMIGTGVGGILCGIIAIWQGEWIYEKFEQLSGYISRKICAWQNNIDDSIKLEAIVRQTPTQSMYEEILTKPAGEPATSVQTSGADVGWYDAPLMDRYYWPGSPFSHFTSVETFSDISAPVAAAEMVSDFAFEV